MNADRLADDVARWCAPISQAEPAGVDARYEPEHEEARTEVAKLESPGADPVDWEKVVKAADGLLSEKSKDLLIASYLGYGLFETHGLPGLAGGLKLLASLMEQHWEHGFPPLRRMRARANALSWFVERSAIRLETQPPSPQEGAYLEDVEASARQLADIARQRLEADAPAFGPLLEQVARARLSAPAAEPAPQAQSSAADAAPASADAVPASSETEERAASSPEQAPVAEASPDDTADDDATPGKEGASLTAEPWRDAMEPWLQPVREDAPAGEDARYDPLHEGIRNEISRFEHPSAGQPDWKRVARDAERLLRDTSKDLLIAAYAGYALYVEEGLDGLAKGVVLLEGLLARYWDELFPDRPRARANALTWFITRFEELGERPVRAEDAAVLRFLKTAATGLAEQARARLEDRAPAVRRLLDQLERLELSIPAATPEAAASEPAASEPAAPPTSTGAAPPTSPAPAAETPVTPSTVSVPSAATAPGEVTNRAEVRRYLTQTRNALADLGVSLRKADPADPSGYRLVRIGLWLTLDDLPPNEGGRTQVPAPSSVVLTEVETFAGSGEWEKALSAAEGAVRRNPFFLDLHRHVCIAAEKLGGRFTAVADAVTAELSGLLRRLPGLPELSFDDGTPFASEATRAWLAQTVLASTGDGATPGTGTENDDPIAIAESATSPQEAFEQLQAVVKSDASGRRRFRARLALAKVCSRMQAPGAAEGLYASLLEDADAWRLAEWEPDLALACARDYHRFLVERGSKRGGMTESLSMVYRHLCRLDPALALEAARASSQAR